jgi:uncharacterized protein (TIGR02453 family)
MTNKYFTGGVFDFLKDLERNNDKIWWDQNKDRYIRVIREPSLEFINDFGVELKKISPELVADTRTVGGSLMRPYRDVRFSKDKTPYKTNIGIQFRHAQGKDVHAPGLYLHIEAGSCFAGAGLWKPEAKVARQIRQAIYDDPSTWKAATKSKRFTSTWSLDGGDDDYLKRIPSEFTDDHPFPDDLRLKSFIAGAKLTQKQVTSDGFVSELSAMFERASDLTGFLCRAIGLRF